MKNIIKGLFLTTLFVSSISYAGVSVIVNPSNKNAVSEAEVSRLFLGKLTKFADGSTAIAVNAPKNDQSRTNFEEVVLKKNASQVKAYWSKLMFSGKGKPPAELSSPNEMLKFVSENANAIGYVDSASVDGSVRVIQTFD